MIGLFQALGIVAGLVVILFVLFPLARGFQWFLAELSFHIGVIGWLAILPVLGWFILESARACRTPTTDSKQQSPPTRWTRVASILAVALVVAGNGCLNIAASRVDALWRERQPYTTEIYKNHDLARLVGQCVRLALLRHAETMNRGIERTDLEALAVAAPDRWMSLVQQNDSRIRALSDNRLTEFITRPKAEALHRDQWISILAEWRAKDSAQGLSQQVLSAAARTIAEDFGITLREALKADFDRGGKAWAAMQLDIAQSLLARSNEAERAGPALAEALAEVKNLLAEDARALPTLNATIAMVRRSMDVHSQTVIQGFDDVVRRLVRLEKSVEVVRVKVESVKEDTSDTRAKVKEVGEQLIANTDRLTENTRDLNDLKIMLETMRSSAPALPAVAPSPPDPAAEAAIKADYDAYLAQRLKGESLPFFKANAPLRYRAWLREARAGNALAQMLVGRAVQEGTGVAPNKAEAVKWFEQSADQGNAAALFNLGTMHEFGWGGLPQNVFNAARLYVAAAERGDVRAMTAVGRCYYHGAGGLPEDEKLALEWHERSANAGDVQGMREAANLWLSGVKGVSADKAKAVQWYTKAADAGDQLSRAVLSADALGKAIKAYFDSGATPAARETALKTAQSAVGQLEPLGIDSLLTIFSDNTLSTASNEFKECGATDPMLAVYQAVVDLTIVRYRSAELEARTRLLRSFSAIAADRVLAWTEAGEHQRVTALWKECLREQTLSRLSLEENGEVVRFATACVVSLYATGYRADATKLADDVFAMCDAVLVERSWDFYLKEAAANLAWRAGAALADLGERSRSQQYLRRYWNRIAALSGEPEILDKYTELPLKGHMPLNVAPEHRLFFEHVAKGWKAVPGETPTRYRILRVTVPCDFGGVQYPFHVYIYGGKTGYTELQDQFIWLAESRGGKVPLDSEDYFRKLNKVAVDNNVDFRDLCDYALNAKKEDDKKGADGK